MSEQFVALGDEDLRTNEVDAGDYLGHGMLDLNTRVHLDEEPLLRINIVKELDSSGVVVADFFRQFYGGFAELVADLFIESKGGRDFDDLLMAALHRTIALVEMNEVAVFVSEDLNFDMLRPSHEPFKKDRRIAKGILRFGLGLIKKSVEIRLLLHHPHATSAASIGRLDDERKTNRAGNLERFGTIRDRLLGSRQGGDVDLLCERTRRDLVSHRIEHLGIRSNKFQTRLTAGAGEIRVFREKSVSRMNQSHSLFFCETHDSLDVEVSTDRALFLAKAVSLVRFEAMSGESIFLRVDRDSAQTQLGSGPEDPDGDFAPVHGHQFFYFFGCRIVGFSHARRL